MFNKGSGMHDKTEFMFYVNVAAQRHAVADTVDNSPTKYLLYAFGWLR